MNDEFIVYSTLVNINCKAMKLFIDCFFLFQSTFLQDLYT